MKRAKIVEKRKNERVSEGATKGDGGMQEWAKAKWIKRDDPTNERERS